MARFTIRGNAKVLKHSSAPTLAAMTAAQVSSATDITGVDDEEALSAMDGWSTSPSTINTPDVKSLQTGNIPGETTFGTGTLTYYTSSTGTNAVWDAETEGTSEYLSIHPNGTGNGTDYTIFSTEVIDRARSLATGNEAETHTISYSIQSRTEGTETT